jgi:ABC-type sugar transport system ATPase subunit
MGKKIVISDNSPLLSVRNIYKSFRNIKALRGINLNIYPGQILAIVGDNGAGKSTLIKILSGVYAPDSGEIKIGNETFKKLTPSLAINKGIATVYQDLALVNCRDVACNVFLGKEPLIFKLFVDKKRMIKESRNILKRLKISVPSVTTPVGLLSGGQQQGVAIAKAANRGGRIMIFDEPTAAIGVKESAQVLHLIRNLGNEGYSVVIISHNLHHVFSIADRICIMKHGKLVGDLKKNLTSPDEIVRLMTGVSTFNAEISC